MTVKTHLISSLVLGITVAPYLSFIGVGFTSVNSIYLYLFAVSIGAIFPDIDEPHSYIGRKLPIFSHLLSLFVEHRGVTHTALLVFLYFLAVNIFASNLVYKIVGFGFIIGNIGHILGDMTTRSGVAIFYPVFNKNIGLIPKEFRYYTGGIVEYAIVLPAFSAILFYQLYNISLTL